MQNQVFYTHLGKLACSYASRLALLRDGLSALFPDGKIDGATAGLHLSLHIDRSPDVIALLQQRCLQAGVRFDTLQDIENGSEEIWRKENNAGVMFFGFGGLQLPQINKVLRVLEQALIQP
ncbi:hypothetical protein D3C81_1768410 [compost metagenome]